MAGRFDKFLNKGNDVLDRAEAKAKERQAMSEDPEQEKQGITAKDMAGASVEYGKDMLTDTAKSKFENKFLGKNADTALEGANKANPNDVNQIDKQNPKPGDAKDGDSKSTNKPEDMKDKYLDKDANEALKDGQESSKLPEKSDSDNMKDKYLNKKSDNLLDQDSGKSGGKNNKSDNNGKNGSNGNKGQKGGNDNKGGGDKKSSSNPFGDTKKKDSKGGAGDLFGKDSKAGSNAAQAGKSLAKEGMKEGAKQGASKASPAGDAVGAAQKIKDGDVDGAVDDAAAFAAGKVAGYYGGPVADKAASFATKAFLKTEVGKLLKGCCCMICLGIVGLAIGAIMFLPMIIVYIMKKVAEILEELESIPVIGNFAGFLKDEIYDALGLSDFEIEDIGQDTNKMHAYANIKERVFENHAEISKWRGSEQQIYVQYEYESGEPHDPSGEQVGEVVFDPDKLISDYLSLVKVFAGLETVGKSSIASELEYYFTNEAEYKFEVVSNITVERKNVTRTVYDPDTGDTREEPDVLITITQTPELILTKATTLTDILTFEGKYVDDNGNTVDINNYNFDKSIRWVQTDVKSEINTEVIRIFNKESWSRSEISSFEYIADCNPINLIYDAGVYGFNSTFQMPIYNTVIAVPYDATTHPYIEVYGKEDTEVMAAAEGVVKSVTTDSEGLYSVTIILGSGVNQNTITYSKLKTAVVTTGNVVKSQVIGTMGDVNLQVEVKNKNGDPVDPNAFLASTYSSAVIHEEDIGQYSMNSYKQGDYGYIGGVSMKDAACGPTSLAMVLSSETCGNQTVSPTVVASLARQKGLWSSAGAAWSMFKELEPYYGYSVSQYAIEPRGYATNGQASPNIATVINAISSRKPVIMLIHGQRYGYTSKFTKGGHFIVVDGFIEGQNHVARILDPASTAAHRKYASLDELFSGAVQAYVFN